VRGCRPLARPGPCGTVVPVSAHDVVTRPRWYEGHAPSRGVLPARAALRSDAPRVDLSGGWRFRWSPRADVEESFAQPAFDDAAWDVISVPGHWQLDPANTDGRWGRPAYTNVQYPFPVDPPFVPDENPTGDYRTTVQLTEAFSDVLAAGGRAVLRFEGVDSAFRVWVDGVEVGRSVGSRLASEFDVTGALTGASDGSPAVVAVRVHQWSSGSYLEDQDMWWLSGIFRDVALLARPAGGVDDVHVHAGYDRSAGTGALRVEVTGGAGARVLVPELGLDLAAGEEAVVPVDPWSPESPRLYDAEVVTAGERVRLRVGFRTVAIVPAQDGEWDVFTVNGARTLMRGVNRHEVSADRGRSTTPAEDLADVLLMKQHGVNAVRTSHYPPHPRFLDLCDEHGLWVVDECDLETHGFWETSWVGNPSDDPAWEAAVVDRMVRTVHRDKNHACVVMWSLGNESGAGRNLSAMARAARAVGTGLPLHYEHDWGYPDSDVVSKMYASHAATAAYATSSEPHVGTPEALLDGQITGARDDAHDALLRAKPFLQCEYAHAMGLGPGGLAEYQELFESSPRCMGGFVWEWIDHGLRQVVTSPDGTSRERWAYGGDFGEVVHDGSFVADGLVLPDRTPSPGLLDLAVAYAPVRVVVTGPAGAPALQVTNRYDVRRLGHGRVALRWTREDDGVEVAAGALEVPDLAPWESAALVLPAAALAPVAPGAQERWVTVTALSAVDEPWAAAGHVLGRGQLALDPLPEVAPSPRPRAGAQRLGADLVLGGARFDAATGALHRLGALPVRDLRLDLWRAPTDNDEGEHDGTPRARQWRELGLDRLQHRVVSVDVVGPELVVVVRVAPASTALGVLVAHRWSAAGAGAAGGGPGAAVRLDVHVEPLGEWTVPWPRLGLRLHLPRSLERVSWFGRGPGEAYPDTGLAAVTGRFSSTVEDLQTPYVVPQENGHRAGARWLELSGPGTPGLRVEGAPTTGFTARRWTSEHLAAARHDAELVPGPDVVLTLDAAVHGTGTASCGPGVLPQHQLLVEPRSFSLVLRELP